MVRRFVQGNRLSRAKSITNKSVVEFKIVSDKPLIAYCLIQGSASTPYAVFIDLKEKLVGHNCPDFLKGSGWCKHLGKLLFMLESEKLDEVYQLRTSLKIIKNTGQIAEQLNKYKAASLSKDIEEKDIPLQKQIELLGNMLAKRDNVSKILPKITSVISKELEEIDKNMILFRIKYLLSHVNTYAIEAFIKNTKSAFILGFKRALDHFFDIFWISSTVKRLEQAYLIQEIASTFKIPLEIRTIEFPKTILEQEKKDAAIILKMLTKEQSKTFKNLQEKLGLKYETDDLIKRARKLLIQIRITSTSVPEIEKWLQEEINHRFKISQSYTNLQDFLIYIMKVAGEQVTYTLKPAYSRYGRSRGGMTTFPVTILEKNPCLNYIIEHIKESEREYLTSKEITNNQKFFNWLAGKNPPSSWIEKPRRRAIDSALNTNGIIIQWDINLSYWSNDMVQTFDGSQRLVIDPGSPFLPMIQPYDYTFCIPQMKERGNRDKITYPQHILLPEQVITLVLQGVPIISNVLPWNILSSFFSKGYLSGGEVSAGIAKARARNYVYGSVDLIKALEDIEMLGKAGLTEESYLEFKARLKRESSRMSAGTRTICREFLHSEGKALMSFIELTDLDEQDYLKLIFSTIKKETTIKSFRIKIIKELLKSYFLAKIPGKEFFENLDKLNLSHYRHAPDMVAEQLRSYYKSIERKILIFNTTKKMIYNVPLGKLLMDDLGISNIGNLTDIDKFTLYQSMIRMRKTFFPKEKFLADLSSKKRITELIQKAKTAKYKEKVVVLTELSMIENKAATNFILSLLEDGNSTVRDLAFVALLYRGYKNLKDVLNKLLTNNDKEVRISSLKNLTTLKDPQILDYVVEATENDDKDVRKFALEKMIESKEQVFQTQAMKVTSELKKCLDKRLNDEDLAIKKFAVDQLSQKREDEQVVSIMEKALDNSEFYVRNKAVNYLWNEGITKITDKMLLKMYTDETPEIRSFVYTKMARGTNPEYVKILEQSFKDPEKKVVNEVVNILSYGREVPIETYSAKIRKGIFNYYLTEDKPFQSASIQNLSRLGDKIILSLLNFLNNEKYGSKESVVGILSSINTKKAINEMVKLTDHPVSNLRLYAFRDLANKKHPKIKTITDKLLEDKNNDVQTAVIDFLLRSRLPPENYSDHFISLVVNTTIKGNLGISGDREILLLSAGLRSFEPLKNVFKSKSNKTKLSAIRILEKIGTKEINDFIVDRFNDKTLDIKTYALNFAVNKKHPRAKELLTKGLESKDNNVLSLTTNLLSRHNITGDMIPDNFVQTIVERAVKENKSLVGNEYNLISKYGKQAIEPLKKAIESESNNTRFSALGILENLSAKGLEEYIISKFDDKDPKIRKLILDYSLRKDHPKSKDILDLSLDDKDETVRERAIDQFLNSNLKLENYSEKMIKIIIKTRLKPYDPQANKIKLILSKAEEIAIPHLKTQIRKNDRNSNLHIAKIVADMKTIKAKEIMIKFFESDDSELKRVALRYLVKINYPKITDVLLEYLDSSDKLLMNEVFYVMSLNKFNPDFDEKIIRLLVNKFLEPNNAYTQKAMTILRNLKKKSTPFLIEGLKSSNRNVVRFSAEILGNQKTKTATNELIKLLNSPEILVQRNVAYALSDISDRKAESAMIAALKYDDIYMRRSLIRGLGFMKSKTAKKPLIKLKKEYLEYQSKLGNSGEDKLKLNNCKTTIGFIEEALQKIS
ncbi:MAG: HEAT repeat domain-containing protein [Candidatus Heimdallarchaeaceae archaeon]